MLRHLFLVRVIAHQLSLRKRTLGPLSPCHCELALLGLHLSGKVLNSCDWIEEAPADDCLIFVRELVRNFQHTLGQHRHERVLRVLLHVMHLPFDRALGCSLLDRILDWTIVGVQV